MMPAMAITIFALIATIYISTIMFARKRVGCFLRFGAVCVVPLHSIMLCLPVCCFYLHCAENKLAWEQKYMPPSYIF